MITVRQIQRLWNSKAYERLLEQLTAPRPEACGRLVNQLACQDAGTVPAAAMVVIRLDELAQTYVPIYGEMVRSILNSQSPDGGWGEVMTTALCLRALLCGQGHGMAIHRGLESLKGLQKEEGIWPAMPVRRMPADAYASSFVMLQLGDSDEFRKAVRFDAAMEWFNANELALDEETQKLWQHTKRRAKGARAATPAMIRGECIPAALAASASASPAPESASPSSTKGFWDFSAALAAS